MNWDMNKVTDLYVTKDTKTESYNTELRIKIKRPKSYNTEVSIIQKLTLRLK